MHALSPLRQLLGWLAITVVLVGLPACERQKSTQLPGDKIRTLANALYNRDLYPQAIAEYEYYLRNYSLDEREQANISYTIGNIYFDRVRDYQSALAYYLRVKELYPNSELVDDANRRIVECLERLQKSADAQQALEESTLLDQTQVKTSKPGEVIAKIGKREVTTGDLDFEIKSLPPYLASQMQGRDQKLEFLKQYLATELLYDTAKRKGLEQDTEVIEAAFQAKKNLMVQKYLQEEVGEKIQLNDSDVELYFKAHQERYAKKDSGGSAQPVNFAQVKSQVAQDYVREKQQEAYQRLVERLMRAENVVIYDDKIR